MPKGNPYYGATFAERKAARMPAPPAPAEDDKKAVHADEVEDKAITSAPRKARKAPSRKTKG